ncbi:hypothetical protein RLIN73S_00694 [Rhodanobacter lindaniclasticus]
MGQGGSVCAERGAGVVPGRVPQPQHRAQEPPARHHHAGGDPGAGYGDIPPTHNLWPGDAQEGGRRQGVLRQNPVCVRAPAGLVTPDGADRAAGHERRVGVFQRLEDLCLAQPPFRHAAVPARVRVRTDGGVLPAARAGSEDWCAEHVGAGLDCDDREHGARAHRRLLPDVPARDAAEQDGGGRHRAARRRWTTSSIFSPGGRTT